MESALVVAVPEAEGAVGAWRAKYDPAAAAGVPAHITVLYPFLDAAVVDGATGEIERLLAGTGPFPITLARIAEFPDVLYLVPEPDEPFRSLTALFWEAWPDHPPYRGAYDDVVPHLTIAQTTDRSLFPAMAESVATQLPITAAVGAVDLLVKNEHGRWVKRRSFPLGEENGS